MSLPPPAYVAAFRSAQACAPEALRRESVERIAKLLPRLAVENDQELLQAARRIARELEASGLDWNDLAAMLREHGVPGRPPEPPCPVWRNMKAAERNRWMQRIQFMPDRPQDVIEATERYWLAPGNPLSARAEEQIDFLIRRAWADGVR